MTLAMGNIRHNSFSRGRVIAPRLCASLCAGTVLFAAALAVAEDIKPGAAPPPQQDTGFFGKIGRWFDEQAANFNANLKNAGSNFENFGHEAGIAAKTTVDNAKGAADAVTRMSNVKVLTVHEKCPAAPNGAPDCLSVATNLCKAKGFQSGKSADMTTAEVCPTQVLLSGRNSGPECHDETFVSRVLCQ
jgi:hypothetical protein